MFWKKKYYLLLVLIDGVFFNTFIEGSISDWLLSMSESDNKVVLINSWKISEREYRRSK